MAIIKEHTRKITFELLDEHPEVGHYCTFGNATAETTDMNSIDFIFVHEILDIDGQKFVNSSDLFAPVMLKYCWRIKMSVHD